MTATPRTGLRVLDLFSCAGGAAMGYHRAGFDVDGVDLADRPRYPFPSHRGDALEHLAHLIETGEIEQYALVHASPPCQNKCGLTVGTNRSRGWGGEHVDLVGPTRDLLDRTGLPYVIEQPNGQAALRKDLSLCGEMFGLGVLRHRNFELGRWSTPSPRTPSTAATFAATDTAFTGKAPTSPRTAPAAARRPCPRCSRPWASPGPTYARNSPRRSLRPSPSGSGRPS